jgi:hypothetical protein
MPSLRDKRRAHGPWSRVARTARFGGVRPGKRWIMDEADLHLEPNEASDLTPVFGSPVLAERDWDLAFATVLDEAPVEKAIAVLVHEAGASVGQGWRALRVAAKASRRKGATQDAEACATRDGWLYIVGSQFGSKEGPLEPARSFIARLREDDVAEAIASGSRAAVDVAWLQFRLHRALNDALAAADVELIELGPRTREAYIDATIRRGAHDEKAWSGAVRSGDHPINVEAVSFRGDGRMLLGLRYPVTADGQPLLVELSNPDDVFANTDADPACSSVWHLDNVGNPREPVGVRALHADGPDRFHAVVGNLDPAGTTILADHPEGGRANSTHVCFSLPLVAEGGAVRCETVRRFEDITRVEGLVTDDNGNSHYVIDRDGHVALRTLLVDQV